MPELSRFYGIIIRMFVELDERHHNAHFHAYYQEHTAVFSISPVAQIAGSLPQRQQRLVEAWANCISSNCKLIGSFSSKAAGPSR